jgi:type IV secretion system protein VirD4
MTPDEVLRLPNDELLCIVRGCNILKLRKFDYTRHPMAREIRRVSVYDYEPRPGLAYNPVAAASSASTESSNPTRKPLLSASKPPSGF